MVYDQDNAMTIGSFAKQLAAEGANDAVASMLDLRGIEAIARDFENISAFFETTYGGSEGSDQVIDTLKRGRDEGRFRDRVANLRATVSHFRTFIAYFCTTMQHLRHKLILKGAAPAISTACTEYERYSIWPRSNFGR